VETPRGVWAWRRGRTAAVAVNMSDRAENVRGLEGTIRLDTARAREGEPVSGPLRLGPWEGVVATT
jgi:hypothetical protein